MFPIETPSSPNRDNSEFEMQLAPHFSFDELIHTEVRSLIERNKICAEARMDQLKATASLLEQVRTLLGGRPLMVHSGYRCPELNQLIGGSSSSQHLKGEAADFHVVGLPLEQAFDQIRHSDLKWGQLILEGHNGLVPTWIHISTPRDHDNQMAGIYNGRTYTWL